MTVSRPVQIFALVALLVAVAGAGMMFLTRKQPSNAPVAVPAHPASRRANPATVAHSKPTRQTSTPAPARRTVTPAVVHKAKPTVAANGLPMVLARALRAHRIVVVSVVDPQSQTDAISFAEARAGARDVGVGFLVVSVLDDLVAGPLTAALNGALLPEPGILIYRRPGTLIQRIDGFADRAAVAQAAVAATTAPPLGVAPTP